MSKSDNHTELGAILEQWLDNAMSTSSMGWSAIDGYKGQEENSEKAAKYDYDNYLKSAIHQIEDFYRNKIPEKSTLKKHIKPNRQIGVPYLSEYDEGFNAAIRRITTQFNSKGDNDE